MAAARQLTQKHEKPNEDFASMSEGEDEGQEEDDEEDDDEEESSASSQGARDVAAFERITPVSDTPWSEFFATMANLLLWGAAFFVVQMFWTVTIKRDVNVAFLPVSILLVPIAVWHLKRIRHLGHLRTDGLQFILHWMLSRNEFLHDICLGTGTSEDNLKDQIRAVSHHRTDRKGGVRFYCGFAWCALFLWMLIVGHACLPFGYIYLVTYSFRRCQAACQTFEEGTRYLSPTETDPKQPARITLAGNASQTREEVMDVCRHKLGMDKVQQPVLLFDLHRYIMPAGDWVVGASIHGNMDFNASESAVKEHIYKVNCTKFSENITILSITGLLVLLVLGISLIHLRSYALVVAATVAVSLLCVTGIFGVWLHWVNCRQPSPHQRNHVFRHLLSGCLFVAQSKKTDFAASMHNLRKYVMTYESNFRHVHGVSRGEVWFGSLTDALLLMLVVAAHSAFKHKEIQTTEARYRLLSGRPKLVRCLLENIRFLDLLPPRDRVMMVRNLQRVYKTCQKQFEDLQGRVSQMLDMDPSPSELIGVGHSFWPAAVYALVRALIPCFFRQLVGAILGRQTQRAVPEENTLWMVCAMIGVVNHFFAYMFVLFQIKEAMQGYSRMMQVWHVFDSLWNFPSQGHLTSDALTEIVQVDRDEDGEVVTMLGRKHRFLGDFTAAQPRSAGDEDGADMVDVEVVRDKLPTWWAWREYLIVDYTDKRVRLEFHLTVAFVVLMTSVSYIMYDSWKEGWRKPKWQNMADSMSWFEGHAKSASFQMAWDLLFIAPLVLQAISQAAAMNHLLEAHLKKVAHIEEVLGTDVGLTVQNIFRLAKAESTSAGGSATRLLGVIRIDRKTLGIVGTIFSITGGGQFLEIVNKLSGGGTE